MIAFVVAVLAAIAGAGDVADHVARLPDVRSEHGPAFVDHVAAAQVAALLTGERAAVLLAVAWHETRFTPDYVQREPAGPVTEIVNGRERERDVWHDRRDSCGVMTPVPIAPPCPSQTLVEQYLAGAVHLRTWRAILHSRALEGLPGGAGSAKAVRFREDMTSLARKIEGP